MDSSQIDKKKSGQIGIWTVIITSVASIFSAGIVGYYTKSGASDAKLEMVKAEQNANVLAISQRVTAVETDTTSIKEDLREIKSDVKSLIKLLK